MAALDAFQVRLGNYRLAKLMPALCEGSHVSGTLMLERGRIRREFTFRDGEMVAGASSSPREHLSQVLSDLHILDARAAAAAFEAAEAQGKPFAQHLVSSGLVSRERLLEALEHKAREGFFDCYTWESGDLWFLPRRTPLFGIEIRVSLAALHRDALARLEEWDQFRAQLPDLTTTFAVRAREDASSATPEEQALLAAAQAGRSLQEILELTPEGTLDVARRILELYRRGDLLPARAAPRSTPEDVETRLNEVREKMAAGQYEQAVEAALRVLRVTSAPEAHELYRSAEGNVARLYGKRVEALEGRLTFKPLPSPPPPELTSDDLYLYSKLKGAGSLVDALRRSATGEAAAARTLFRLIDCGVIAVSR